jgi:PmbA protein
MAGVAYDILALALERLSQRGFDAAEAQLTDTRRDELQAEFNRASMLRTTNNRSLSLGGLVGGKRASATINKCGSEDVFDAVDELWISANAAAEDEANTIAERQPAGVFEAGPQSVDRELMYERLDEFLAHSATAHPTVILGMVGITHELASKRYMNSNGVDFRSSRGSYDAGAMFTARDGEDVSSFSYSGANLNALDVPLSEIASFERLMNETAQHVRTEKVPGKFTGDMIITPDCLRSFLGFLLGNISGAPMITGTSVYHGRRDEQVASKLLTLSSKPTQMPGGYSITGDGFPATDLDVVEAGVLKQYLLDLYASRKTGLSAPAHSGGCYVVAPGETALADMIKYVDEGILISRFSGGQPSAKGDFSGVAKSSFYICDGEVRYPVSETMVSGNMVELLMNVVAVSRETVNFGSASFPWVRVTDVVIS